MQAIKNGDLYFLESPFHSDIDSKLEKRLSYLLGTVSSRPAVVVRQPNWWDPYNTVTVIPALSKGEPAITFHLMDRYGCLTESDYPFMPHNPHTIPVARLGKHIGSLDPDELEELLYAFHWIHDSEMQRDKSKPVPPVYKELFERQAMKSWKMNKDARADVSIFVKPDMTLQSQSNPELNGMKMDINLRKSVNPKVLNAVENEMGYYATEQPTPDATAVKEEAADQGKEAGRVPVERSFPPSIFDYNTLCDIAGRFTISDAYYKNEKKTRALVLNDKELENAFDGPVDTVILEEVSNIYKKFTPMDAYILGPRLPTLKLSDILNIDPSTAIILKRICNIMRDMSEEEYQARVAIKKPVIEEEPVVTEEVKPDTSTFNNQDEITSNMKLIQSYMNPKGIMCIPQNLQSVFMRMPKYMIKRYYQGANFSKTYSAARAKYDKATKNK